MWTELAGFFLKRSISDTTSESEWNRNSRIRKNMNRWQKSLNRKGVFRFSKLNNLNRSKLELNKLTPSMKMVAIPAPFIFFLYFSRFCCCCLVTDSFKALNIIFTERGWTMNDKHWQDHPNGQNNRKGFGKNLGKTFGIRTFERYSEIFFKHFPIVLPIGMLISHKQLQLSTTKSHFFQPKTLSSC